MDTISKMLVLLVDIKLAEKTERDRLEKAAQELEKKIMHLPELEKCIIENVYGLVKGERKSYEIIAADFNITEEEVIAAHSNALRLLR